MEQTPRNEKTINEMARQELVEQLTIARAILEGLLIEVEQYPEPEQRDQAKEKASAQFDAIIAMTERLGDLKRNLVTEMKEGETERDIPIDPLSNDIRPII